MNGTAEHTHDWTCYGWKPWPGSPTGTRYLWRCDGCGCLSGTFTQEPPGVPPPCWSTHGGSGYAPNSYWDGDAIVCGACKARIENPLPTCKVWRFRPGLWNRVMNNGQWEPVWPEWIGGTRGTPKGTR